MMMRRVRGPASPVALRGVRIASWLVSLTTAKHLAKTCLSLLVSSDCQHETSPEIRSYGWLLVRETTSSSVERIAGDARTRTRFLGMYYKDETYHRQVS